MITISRSKKAKKVVKKQTKDFDRWTDEPFKKKKKEYKEPNLCSCEGCQNFKMETSDVCPECYMRISNEMAQTVSEEDSKPLKLFEESSYQKFMKLIEGEKDEGN